MKPIMDERIYEQPDKCKNCVWGKWTGTKQTCLTPRCIKILGFAKLTK